MDFEKYQLIKSLSNKCVLGVFLIKIFDLSNGFIKKLSKKKKLSNYLHTNRMLIKKHLVYRNNENATKPHIKPNKSA